MTLSWDFRQTTQAVWTEPVLAWASELREYSEITQ